MRNLIDKENLQVMIHYYGYEKFLDMLIQTLYNASEEMEDISIQKSEEYSNLATTLQNLRDDNEI